MKSIYSRKKPAKDISIRLRGWHGDATAPLSDVDRMSRHIDAPPRIAPIPPRTPEDLLNGKPEGVFEPDSREIVHNPASYPYSAVCGLTIMNNAGKRYYGTGFVAGPRLILTAGHNVFYHDDGGFMKEIQVYPGLNGDRLNPVLPTATSTQFATVEGWANDANSLFDFGAIFLDQDIGQSTGTFSVSKFTTLDLKAMTVTLTGYPKDPPRNSGRPNDGSTQFRAAGRLTVESHRLLYFIDSSIGQSGSPLVAYFADKNEYHAVGIHNTAYVSSNAATRITDEVFAQILKWRRKSDS
jgi:V8-like Glu-specific endopeptidase